MDTYSDIFELLESKYILSSKNISDIREYIGKKYAHSNTQKNTLVFANTVNSIIENQLSHFTAPYRPILRKNILKTAMNKQSFSITANDVLVACIDTHNENENVLDEFKNFSENILGFRIPKEFLSKSFSTHTAEFKSISHTLNNIPANTGILINPKELSKPETIIAFENADNKNSDNSKMLITIQKPVNDKVIPAIIDSHHCNALTSIHEFTDCQMERCFQQPINPEVIIYLQEPFIKEAIKVISNKQKTLYKILWHRLTDFFINTKSLFKLLRKFILELKKLDFKTFIKKFFTFWNDLPLKLKTAFFSSLVIFSVIIVINYDANNIDIAVKDFDNSFIDVEKTQENRSSIISSNLTYIKTNIKKMAETQRNVHIEAIDPAKLLLNDDIKNNASKKLDLLATAYDLSFDSYGKDTTDPRFGITTLGTKATKGRTLAVNPTVIPLRSKVYIEFPEKYSHLNGIYVAEDLSIYNDVENMVGIFFGEDKPGENNIYNEVLEFGVNKVTIYIL